jgi:hypothetical protein
MLQSFDILWPNTILHRIVTKTNRHAQYVIDEIDNPMGIPKPNDLTIPCLKALFFNSLIYGIKIPIKYKINWYNVDTIFVSCYFQCHDFRPFLTITKVFASSGSGHLFTSRERSIRL